MAVNVLKAKFTSEVEWEITDEQMKAIMYGEEDVADVIGSKFWKDAFAYMVLEDYSISVQPVRELEMYYEMHR